VQKPGKQKLTQEETEQNLEAKLEHDALQAFNYIQLLYAKGVFQCPGSMESLDKRRDGLFPSRDERRDVRFQEVKRKRSKSKAICLDDDFDESDQESEADQNQADQNPMKCVSPYPPTSEDDELVGDYKELVGDYKFMDVYPFQYPTQWIGINNTQFRLDTVYIKDIMKGLKYLTSNPQNSSFWQQIPKMNQLLPLLKHTSAIVYFAIATQTGPLFESNSNSHDHQTIGKMNPKGYISNGYYEHERAVARQLFQALQVKKKIIDIILDEEKPGRAETGRATLSHKDKITLYKTCILYHLGMSGKPSWDARVVKKTRKGTPWTQSRKENKRKSNSGEEEEASSRSNFKMEEHQSNPMQEAMEQTKTGDEQPTKV
jgi:hypothetical protein